MITGIVLLLASSIYSQFIDPGQQCGSATGLSCGFENCCSSSGYCGRDNAYCGNGCQGGFGVCGQFNTFLSDPGSNGRALAFSPFVDVLSSDKFGNYRNLAEFVKKAGLKSVTLGFANAVSNADGTNFRYGDMVFGSNFPVNFDFAADWINEARVAGGSGFDLRVSIGGAVQGKSIDPALLPDFDAARVQSSYQKVIDGVKPNSLDFDIENAANTDAINKKRAVAVAALQRANNNIPVSFTLVVNAGTGLDASSRSVVTNALQNNIDFSINLMCMNFDGNNVITDQTTRCFSSLKATKAQFPQFRGKYELTMMIGQNDVSSQYFNLEDINRFVNLAARDPSVSKISHWGLHRDVDSGSCKGGLGYCSFVAQSQAQFSIALQKAAAPVKETRYEQFNAHTWKKVAVSNNGLYVVANNIDNLFFVVDTETKGFRYIPGRTFSNVAVCDDAIAWAVQPDQSIFRSTKPVTGAFEWQQIPGTLDDIDCGGSGKRKVWGNVLGFSFYFDEDVGDWRKYDQNASDIKEVTYSQGEAWCIQFNGGVFWTPFPGDGWMAVSTTQRLDAIGRGQGGTWGLKDGNLIRYDGGGRWTNLGNLGQPFTAIDVGVNWVYLVKNGDVDGYLYRYRIN